MKKTLNKVETNLKLDEFEEEDLILEEDDIDSIDVVTELVSIDADSAVEPEPEDIQLSESTLSYYMHRIAGSTPITKEAEQELGRRMKQGDIEAFEKLVKANLKFVIKVANRFKNSGLPMSDIISQGNLGLLEAAKRYDPDKGVKFISYAVWWIRQYIIQGIAEQSGTVKLPIKQAGNLFKINNAKEKLSNNNGREATVTEISEYLGMSEEDVTDILRVSKQSLSLETPLKDGEGKTFVDYLESKDESVEDKIIKKNLKGILGEMIDELDGRERQIINLRFGFDDEEIKTLDEIGKIFGVSRERVRQLESRAIEKLKKKATKKGLQFYLAS